MSEPYYQLIGFADINGLLAHYRDATELVRVDLGCGYYKPPGFIGIDEFIGAKTQIKNDDNLPDIIMDLNTYPIPLPDFSCSEIRASHFIEHSVMDHVFTEVNRLLIPDGIFMFTVPYANSWQGMSPGHRVFLTESFFHENIRFQTLFEITKEEFKPSPDYLALPQTYKDVMPFDLARKFLYNVCSEMTLTVKPKK